MTQDDEHLRLLSIFHYVLGGLVAVCSLIPVFHLILGLFFALAPGRDGGRGDLPPAFLGWLFVIFALLLIVCGLIFAALVLTTGRFLASRKHRLFCLVMGGVECAFMPLGTVLGVFTILVLMRDSVKPLFADARSGGQTGAPPPASP